MNLPDVSAKLMKCDSRRIGATVTIVNRRPVEFSVEWRTNRGYEYTILLNIAFSPIVLAL